MMTLNEFIETAVLAGQKPFFETLKRKGNYSFGYYYDDMDNMLKLNYGDKLLNPKLENMSIESICGMIMLEHGEKWNKYYSMSRNNIDMTANTSRVITEEIETNISNRGTGSSVNKVSAYNSDDMLNSDGNESESTGNEEKEVLRRVTDSNVSLTDMYENLNLVAKHNIMSVAIKDVVDYATLSIY